MSYTLQQTFDMVINGLRAQGKPAFDQEEGVCKYRLITEDGELLKCAAGQLIPDNLYDPIIEGQSFQDNSNNEELYELFGELKHNIDLVADLQLTHDNYAISEKFMEELEDGWKRIALKYGLIYHEI